jgi:hypothetical protein
VGLPQRFNSSSRRSFQYLGMFIEKLILRNGVVNHQNH